MSKIIHTYYCPDCEEVFDRSKAKDNSCPSCTNRSTMNFLAMLAKAQPGENKVLLSLQVERLERAAACAVLNAVIGPDTAMEGATDCYHVPIDDIDALRGAIKP